MLRPVVIKLFILLSFATSHAALHTQSTEAALKARLKDKQLYLRGCWGGPNLSFDSEGKLLDLASKTSFTLSGFELKSLQMKNGRLTLKGKRMGIEFINDRQRLVPIHIDDPKIEITAPANGNYGPALDAIFTDNLGSLAPAIPAYWETWGRKNIPNAYAGIPVSKLNEPQADEKDHPAPDSTKPKQVGGDVHAPVIEEHSEAEFDAAARKLKYTGKCVLSLIVGTDGRPRQVRIDRPIGLGLDEQAVDAVEQYLFKPATQDGKPVPVEVHIEVNFQIY